MQFDENKIINDLSKSPTGLNDYKSLLHSEKEYNYKLKQKKIMALAILLAVYTLFSIGLLIFFRNKANDILLWPLKPAQESTNIILLEKKLDNLSRETNNLNEILSKSVENNYSVSYFNSKLEKLNNSQKSIEEAISLDPEKVLTTTFLREKQKNLESSFLDLRNSQDKLDSKLDNFITTVIVVPIITAILGFIIWVLQSKYKKDN